MTRPGRLVPDDPWTAFLRGYYVGIREGQRDCICRAPQVETWPLEDVAKWLARPAPKTTFGEPQTPAYHGGPVDWDTGRPTSDRSAAA